MQKVGSPLARWWGGILALSILLIITADQLTKAWVRSYAEGSLIYQLGFLRIVHVQNTGAAFGIFPSHSSAIKIAATVGIFVLVAVGYLVYRRMPALVTRLNIIAFGLILGGMVGNLIDRWRMGYVTDFIDVSVWPAFNIADSATTVGAVIIAYSLIRLTIAEMRHSPE